MLPAVNVFILYSGVLASESSSRDEEEKYLRKGQESLIRGPDQKEQNCFELFENLFKYKMSQDTLQVAGNYQHVREKCGFSCQGAEQKIKTLISEDPTLVNCHASVQEIFSAKPFYESRPAERESRNNPGSYHRAQSRKHCKWHSLSSDPKFRIKEWQSPIDFCTYNGRKMEGISDFLFEHTSMASCLSLQSGSLEEIVEKCYHLEKYQSGIPSYLNSGSAERYYEKLQTRLEGLHQNNGSNI